MSMTWRAIFDGPWWVVFARPDVVFADDIPVERMCAPSAGRSTARPFSQLDPFCPETSTVVYTLQCDVTCIEPQGTYPVEI